MAVKVRFRGGPLDGKKNTLTEQDAPPQTIRNDKAARARNMQGLYRLEHGQSKEPYQYYWEKAAKAS